MAKIDMFDGKIDETPDSKKKLNTWYDTLIGCPSQCYYYFVHEDIMYCIYLRWRHRDPWTCEITKCAEGDFSLAPDTSTWKFVKIAYFEENELEKLKEYILNRLDIITALWPHVEHDISLRIEDYKTLPSDVREKVVGLTIKLVEENKMPERKSRPGTRLR